MPAEYVADNADFVMPFATVYLTFATIQKHFFAIMHWDIAY